jgi:TDG/mug DNA glycosylase family protein
MNARDHEPDVPSLCPLLKTGLRVVFIGVRPGRDSLAAGHYYSNAGNAFYIHLKEAGFTPVTLLPVEDARLLQYGIGLDDVYSDSSAVRERVEVYTPRAVCFNSKQALELYVGAKILSSWEGANAHDHVRFIGTTITWAVPDSSGMARRYHKRRLALLRELRLVLERLGT